MIKLFGEDITDLGPDERAKLGLQRSFQDAGLFPALTVTENIAVALERYAGNPPPDIWYYRGAWQEWSIAEADILIPLSEEELRRKISAIFKHQSQKDRAPFPGVDEREFWQRIEERNKATAHLVDQLGLPEYFAMEAIVVRPPASKTRPTAHPPR